MIELSPEQAEIVEYEGNMFVTACPGSGKTRVLAQKMLRALEEGVPVNERVIAVTFTNRAADEIASRMYEGGFSRKFAWTGTIHAFALEWILRPYSGYVDSLRKGFTVADEHYVRKAVDALKPTYGIRYFDDVRLGFDRAGNLVAPAGGERALVEEYRAALTASKLIDFDSVLYLAYDLLQRKCEIARTLGAIFNLVCIDEYQDTQDLQYGILSSIVRASEGHARVFIVGDKNQAIYSSLGGVAKTTEEIRAEFGLEAIRHRELDGNYRSTQRIVDFSANFQDGTSRIRSLAPHARERGCITFCDQGTHKDALADSIAALVEHHLANNVKEEDICILAPKWAMVTSVGRRLLLRLPHLDLDAPGLSPLRYQPDSIWFKLARLFLTDASPKRFRTRNQWAGDFVTSLEIALGHELAEESRGPRQILRLRNDIESTQNGGLEYLEDVFTQFFSALAVDLAHHPLILDERLRFFQGVQERLAEVDDDIATSVDSLKKMFRHPAGVVVNTCHGIKGEEYSVVICFGILRGCIPHWNRIIGRPQSEGRNDARRILYVVSSRAKKFLHLYAENGRTTQRRDPYITTEELRAAVWDYDERPC